MKHVRSGDAKIAYEVRGDGPALLLVHGTGASGITTWSPVMERLGNSRLLIVPDLRGSGNTRAPERSLELDELGSDVLAVALHAGLERFDVAGFSLGASVAAYLAANHPDRVKNLVLIAAAMSGRDSRTRLLFGIWRDLFERDKALFARYWLLTGLSPNFVSAIPTNELDRAATFPLAPGLVTQSMLNTRLDLRPVVGRIQARTLVIGCSHDAVVPADRAKQLAGAIRGAKYVELDTGHMAVLEAPDRVARILEEFLGKGNGSRALLV
jgi:3-oxoadipate enol-lactonase